MAKIATELMTLASVDNDTDWYFALAKSMGRLWQHTKNHNIGMLSAFRPEYTLDENRKRNQQLSDAVRQHGFGFVKVKGYYPDLEESFFVVSKPHDSGNLLGFLKKYGKLYDQDSVLYKPHDVETASIIGTKPDVWPGEHKSEQLGPWHPQKLGEYYSMLRGRPFTFAAVAPVRTVHFTDQEVLF